MQHKSNNTQINKLYKIIQPNFKQVKHNHNLRTKSLNHNQNLIIFEITYVILIKNGNKNFF